MMSRCPHRQHTSVATSSVLFNGAVAALVSIMALRCDRPFVEVREPEIEIVDPDLTTVITTPSVDFRVRATSFRPIQRVLLGEEAMDFDASSGYWAATRTLSSGVNRFVITAFDTQNVVAVDTVVVVHLIAGYSINAPDLPNTAGDHAAVLMNDGSLLVTGGAFHVNGEAEATAFLASPAGGAFQELPAEMTRNRRGHTMTNLPDGRVLILGGATRANLTDILGLVEEPEIFDPATRTFRPVIFTGDPIRRTEHTASARMASSGVIIDLFGGLGDIQYRPTPRFGVRDDIRSFEFRNDSLIALSPGVGPFLGEPISGHTQTLLAETEPFLPGNYLVHGTHFGVQFFESTSFTVDFADPLGLLPMRVGNTLEPRTNHAAERIFPGLIVTMGGNPSDRTVSLGSVELFLSEQRRFLRLPVAQAGLQRSGQSATKISDGRIIILGGFLTGGNSTSLSEYFLYNTD